MTRPRPERSTIASPSSTAGRTAGIRRRSAAKPIGWLAVVAIVLGTSGCRTVLWKIEQGCETAHRNVGAFCRRTAFLTVPQYRVPGGYSESYARSLDAYDRAHPLRTLTPPIPATTSTPITIAGAVHVDGSADPGAPPIESSEVIVAPR